MAVAIHSTVMFYDLFSVHYTFLPRIQADFDTFAEAWNLQAIEVQSSCGTLD